MPDLLILDEPTNHLDLKGISWLLEELQQYQGAVLIISHDRYFLDQSVSKILELEDGNLHTYQGNYSAYRREKKRLYEERLHQYEVQQKQKKKSSHRLRLFKIGRRKPTVTQQNRDHSQNEGSSVLKNTTG
ncbi:hypothetical protein AAGG52_12535 [Bacillus licheniformis]